MNVLDYIGLKDYHKKLKIWIKQALKTVNVSELLIPGENISINGNTVAALDTKLTSATILADSSSEIPTGDTVEVVSNSKVELQGTTGTSVSGLFTSVKVPTQSYVDKKAVTNVTYNGDAKTLQKTINGNTSTVVTLQTIKNDLNLTKTDVGLGNVDNTADKDKSVKEAGVASTLKESPALTVSDNQKIQVTVGGKQSEAITVPYASSAESVLNSGVTKSGRTLAVKINGVEESITDTILTSASIKSASVPAVPLQESVDVVANTDISFTLTNDGKTMSGSFTATKIPTKAYVDNNMQSKITESSKLDASLISGLAAVATTGSYSDLSNTPSKLSEFANDLNFSSTTGTVTGVTVNNNTYNPVNGIVDIGTVITDVSGKVDKVDGKGLSTNDYTTSEKTKLASITANATPNQNAFGQVNVGTTQIKADAEIDTLTIAAGDNISITGNADQDKVVFSVPTMVGATSQTKGSSGAVPSPEIQDAGRFLRGDGTWAAIQTYDAMSASEAASGTNTSGKLISAAVLHNKINALLPGDATTSASGLLSNSDKAKLDGIESGAQKNQNSFSSVGVYNGGSYIGKIDSDNVTDSFKLDGGANVSLSVKDDSVIISSQNTTYNLSSKTNTSKGEIQLATTDATAAADTVYLEGGTGIAVSSNDAKTVNISHTTSGVTAGNYGESDASTTSGSFNVPYLTIDARGHVTAASNKSVTLPQIPNNYSSIKVGSTTIGPSTTSDTLSFSSGSGITLTGATDGITVTHTAPGTGTAMTLTAGDDKTIQNGGNFEVVTGLSKDSLGHITGAVKQKITLPSYTIGNGKLSFGVSGNSTASAEFTANQSAASTFEVPIASTTGTGVIGLGYTTTENRKYPLLLDSNNKAYVEVPWENTEVTSADKHYSPSSNSSYALTTTASGTATIADGGSVVTSVSLARDSKGHVTGLSATTGKIDYPTIPTVNDGTLTIKTEGVTKGTFSANSASNVTLNITASDLGLASAMHFIGQASSTKPAAGNYKIFSVGNTVVYVQRTTSGTATAIMPHLGDVFILGNKEYVCTALANAATSASTAIELGDESIYSTAAFKTIAVNGQSNVEADSKGDTLTLAGDDIIALTTDATNDKVSISHSSVLGTAITSAKGGVSGNKLTIPIITADKFGHLKSVTTADYTVSHPETRPNEHALTIKGAGTSVESYTGSAVGEVDFVAGNNITITPTDGKITISGVGDSHWTSKNVVGASASATANAAATNGNVYLNHLEGTTVTSSHNIKGENGVTVTSTSSGGVVITGPGTIPTNHKTKQTAVSDPTASGSATAFIDSISQNANGEIAVTKKNVSFPNAFGKISISGQNDVTADSSNDTLTFAAGNNITLTSDSSTDKVTIGFTPVTANRAIVSNANGLPSASSITSTELGYLSGVTSSVQTQLTNLSNKKYWADIELSSASQLNTSPTFDPMFKVNVTPGNTIIQPSNTSNAAWASPISKYLWHDLLAFGANGHPTVEYSTDGQTWQNASSLSDYSSLQKGLFIHKEDQAMNGINDSRPHLRWTWEASGLHACRAAYFIIGFCYTSTCAKVNIIIESENKQTDGSYKWVTQAQYLNTAYNQTPVWFSLLGDWTNPRVLRVTLSRVNGETGKNCTLSSMRLLTSRWGNQGKGSEYEYPYAWSTNSDIYPKANETSDLGITGNIWKTIRAVNISAKGFLIPVSNASGTLGYGSIGQVVKSNGANIYWSNTSHSHSFQSSGSVQATTATGTIGDATQTGSVSSTFTGTAHSHTFTGTGHTHSFSVGNHTHTFSGSEVDTKATASASTKTIKSITSVGTVPTRTLKTVATDKHTHAVEAAGTVTSSFTGSEHTHTFTGTEHTHTFTGTATNTGAASATTTVKSVKSVGTKCSASYSAGKLTITFGDVPTVEDITVATAHTHSVTATGTISGTTAGGTVGKTTAGGSVSSTFIGSGSTTGQPSAVLDLYSISDVGSVPTTEDVVVALSGHTHKVTAAGSVTGGSTSGTTDSTTAGGSIENTTAGGSVSSTFSGNKHSHTFTGTEHTHTFTGGSSVTENSSI